ncbi:MAG: hypothetical protein GEU91_13870 [Rhizobiales bacterium]|nr:hypothetical protein [Hyphomicrobiales bacterium]
MVMVNSGALAIDHRNNAPQLRERAGCNLPHDEVVDALIKVAQKITDAAISCQGYWETLPSTPQELPGLVRG